MPRVVRLFGQARSPEARPERIVQEVRHDIATLPGYRVFDYITYKVDGSKVILFGSVTRPLVKSEAAKAVKRIEGVTNVDNEIELLPRSALDDQIRIAVYSAIYSKAPLQKYQFGAEPPIHIIVQNSNVTLEGTVNSDGDKDLAGVTAKEAAGVLKVTNNLSSLPDHSGIVADSGGIVSFGEGARDRVPKTFRPGKFLQIS